MGINMGSTNKNAGRNIFRLSMVLFLIIMSIGYSFFLFYRVNNQYMDRLKETGDELSNKILYQMHSSVEYVKGMAKVFSQFEDIHDDKAIDLLVELSEESKYARLWLTKINGDAISSEFVNANAKNREYLQRAKKGESGISDIQVSSVNGIRNVVVFSPTYFNNEVTGMFIGIYELSELAETISIQCFDGKGYCYVYTDDGEIVATSGIVPKNNQMQEKYGYSTKIGNFDWNVFVTFPGEVIQGEIKENIIITVIMCVLYLLVLAILFFDTYWSKNKELKEKAQKDSLTQLTNRETMENIINESISKISDNGCGLILFDIDRFKGVNDTVGHVSGDEVLIKIAQIMKEEFSEDALLGRLGGDEFVMFIKDIKSAIELNERLQVFKDRIKNLKSVQGKKINISASLGVVYTSDYNSGFDELYKIADNLMYESKRKGGDTITYSEV